MNIPALINIEYDDSMDGKMAVVDGKTGSLIVEPDADTLKKYQDQKDEELRQRAMLKELKGKTTETKSGHKIHLYANIGSTGDVASVLANDAEGIGLFRSEFIYLEKDNYPTEEEQFQIYKAVAQNMAGKKVIIRTLDIGADKQIDYFDMAHERIRQWVIVQSVSAWTDRKYLRHSFVHCSEQVCSEISPLCIR